MGGKGSGRQSQPINHGTWGGYLKHKRAGEQACWLCKEAMRAKARAKYVAKPREKQADSRLCKQIHVIEIKLRLASCLDCGIAVTRQNFMIFQFDHLNRQIKIATIAEMVQTPRYKCSDIDIEIAKCEMVCGNCHAIRGYYRGDHMPLIEVKKPLPTLFDN